MQQTLYSLKRDLLFSYRFFLINIISCLNCIDVFSSFFPQKFREIVCTFIFVLLYCSVFLFSVAQYSFLLMRSTRTISIHLILYGSLVWAISPVNRGSNDNHFNYLCPCIHSQIVRQISLLFSLAGHVARSKCLCILI